MRLLDSIAQSSEPLLALRDGAQLRLPSACDFAADVSRCPLRYVLTDDLLRLCVDLAYSEGDELSGCLDLVHFPAERMWIEWDDGVKRAELARFIPVRKGGLNPSTARKGVLLQVEPGDARACRSCHLRTFWSQQENPAEALVSAAVTHLDLDHPVVGKPERDFINGGPIVVRDPADACVDKVLEHTSFRLDPGWRSLYRSAARGATDASLVQGCLAGVIFDVPFILALLLVMSLRSGLAHQRVDRSRINAKRSRLNKPPLLEHIEVSCPALTAFIPAHAELHAIRGAPRLHHVRGHIVRREDAIFWRRPHWRGHLRLGTVRTRTVELRVPAVTRAEMAAAARGSAGLA